MTNLNLHISNRRETQAKDIMSTSLITLSADDTYGRAVELLSERKLIALPVIDSLGKLLGILSEKDILKECNSFEEVKPDFLKRKINFQKELKTVFTTTSINELGSMLASNSYRHLPVIDQEGYLKGIISRRDLIRIIYLRLEIQKAQSNES